MFTRKMRLLAVALPVAAFCVLHSSIAQQIAPQRAGTITGHVMTSGGTPAVGARISAMPTTSVNGAEILSSIARTDGAGEYRLENLLPGEYYVRVGPTGFLTYYPSATDTPGATVVTVKAGLTTDRVDIRISGFEARVTGRLPAALALQSGVPLSVVLVAPGGQTLEAPVASDGTFDFPKVPPGAFSAMTFPNLGLQPCSVFLEGKDIAGIEIGGPNGVRVSGKVSGSLVVGGAVPARVFMQATQILQGTVISAESPMLEAEVAADGAFTVPSVPPGRYGLFTSASNTGVLAVAITVTDRDIGGIELKPANLAANSSKVKVSGRVLDVPALTGNTGPRETILRGTSLSLSSFGGNAGIGQAPPCSGGSNSGLGGGFSGAVLRTTSRTTLITLNARATSRDGGINAGAVLRPIAGGTSLQAVVDSTGSFSFAAVAPGVYQLTTPLVAAQPILLEVADRDIAGIVLQAVPSTVVRVRGLVKRDPADSASPLPPKVLLSGPTLSAGPKEAAVGQDGRFEFSSIGPGTYIVQTDSAPTATTAIVVADQDVTGAEIVLPLRHEIAGRFVTEDGSRLPAAIDAAQVWLIGASNRGVGPNVRADGSFRFSLADGEYRITSSNLPLGYYVKAVSQDGMDLAQAPLKVQGLSNAELRMTLAAVPVETIAGVRIRGRVIGFAPEAPGPAVSARVRLVPLSDSIGSTVETSIAPDGAFTFEKVPQGAFMARMMTTSQTIVATSVTVATADIDNLVLTMRR